MVIHKNETNRAIGSELSSPDFQRHASHLGQLDGVTIKLRAGTTSVTQLTLQVGNQPPFAAAQQLIQWDPMHRIHVPQMYVKDFSAPGYCLDDIQEHVAAFREISVDRTLERCEKFDTTSDGHHVVNHEIRAADGSYMAVEFVHQARPGDCILANFLNTWAIERDGVVPCTVPEAREIAKDLREIDGESAHDILMPDSALSYRDVIALFSMIHKQTPRQSDIITFDGRSGSLRRDIADMLNQFQESNVKSLVCGVSYHCTSLVKTSNQSFLWYDPLNPDVSLREYNFQQAAELLYGKCNGRSPEKNFFFRIRQ